MTDSQDPSRGSGEPWLDVTSSRDFVAWLEAQRISIAFSTYQTGKLFLLGRTPLGTLSVFERTFPRSMGLWAQGNTLWMASHFQIWKFENALFPGNLYEGYDRVFVPRIGYTTGDLDVHDLACDDLGRLIFANTRFSCLATLSDRYSFAPLWNPPQLSSLVAEDRCHLNGLAMDEGRPRYVTVVGLSDFAEGWRSLRRDGGCVLEVPSGAVICAGLSMPHSPRVYQGQLWLLDSGTGYFGSVNSATARFEPMTFCPGYLRGLAFVGDYAVVGVSRPRGDRTLSGLELDDNLTRHQAEPQCGLLVINLKRGEVVHWVRIEGMVSELYDVVVLPGAARPMALGFKSEEIKCLLTMDQSRAI